jgi:hypothetical protein
MNESFIQEEGDEIPQNVGFVIHPGEFDQRLRDVLGD